MRCFAFQATGWFKVLIQLPILIRRIPTARSTMLCDVTKTFDAAFGRVQQRSVPSVHTSLGTRLRPSPLFRCRPPLARMRRTASVARRQDRRPSRRMGMNFWCRWGGMWNGGHQGTRTEGMPNF